MFPLEKDLAKSESLIAEMSWCHYNIIYYLKKKSRELSAILDPQFWINLIQFSIKLV